MTLDQQKAMALAAARQRADQPEDTGYGSMARDVAASAGSGLARGAADLVGLPGTLSDAFNNGMSYITGLPQLPQSPLSGGTARQAASSMTGGATDYQPQTTAGKYASTAAEFVPGALALGGPSVVNALQYGVVPGLASEAAGQATQGTAYEPYARMAGAIAAPMAISGAQRLVTPFSASPERIAQANSLAAEGIDLTAGQKTGNNALRYTESELGGNGAGNFMEKQGEQFTQAALKRIGENATRATPDVINNAFDTIGGKFNSLAQRNTLIPDQQMLQESGDVLRGYNSGVAPSFRAPLVGDTVADISAKASQGPISGDWYQSTASNLASKARATNNPELKGALYDLREALDNAMERSLGANNPADLGLLKEARNQYKNLLVIEKAATGAGENAAQGIISPQQLRSAVVNQSRRNYARGNGDFADLARAGEATMRPLPNSGTAARMSARNMGASVSSLLGAGGGASLGGPIGAIAGAAAGAALPAALGKAILSKAGRAYLSNQLLSPTRLTDPRIAAVAEALLSRQQGRLKDR